MDLTKYYMVPTEFATAKEIGIAAATLGAMARRGLVEVLDTTPKQYRRIENPALKIYQLYEKHEDDFFVLYKKNENIGMLCSMSKGDVIDCWGKKYDLTNVCRAVFKKASYEI